MRVSSGASHGHGGGQRDRIDLAVGDLVHPGCFVGLGMEHSAIPQRLYRLVATQREPLAFLGSFTSVSVPLMFPLVALGCQRWPRERATTERLPGRSNYETICNDGTARSNRVRTDG